MINEKPAIEGGKPVRNKYLVFGSPLIGQGEIGEVIKSLRSGWLSTGPKVSLFENNLKNYLKANYIKVVNSCTAAMHLSLIVAGIGRGDEVITCPMTFASTGNVILHVGATPVFVDAEKDTGNIDVAQIEEKITKKTKAIMPIHLHGRPCKMNKILEIAKKYKLIIIEDAAHAFGAAYNGKKIGTIGDFTCFSFYVTKNLIMGEGGAVATNRKNWAELIEMYAMHGMSRGAWKRYSDSGYSHYLIQVPGYKYNLMDLQAAIGIHQLKKFDKMQDRRKKIWDRYNEAFRDLPLKLPAPVEKNTIHAYHLYGILVNLEKLKVNRDFILNALHKENIGSGVHFVSLHLHPYYKKLFNFAKNDFPNAAFISDRTISLPLSAKLTDKDVEDVIKAVRKIILCYSK